MNFVNKKLLEILNLPEKKQIGHNKKPMLVVKEIAKETHDPCKKSETGRDKSSFQTKKSFLPRSGYKRQRRSYFNFEKVLQIFPEASLDELCKVSELTDFSPSQVRSLVPSASAKQISKFLQLAEESIGKTEILNSPPSGEKDRDDPVLPGFRERTPLLATLNNLESSSGTNEVTFDFVKTTNTVVPTKDGDSEHSSQQFFKHLHSKFLELGSTANSSAETQSENLYNIYQKVKFDHFARSRLENLHAARGFKYGHTHLGSKSWYRVCQCG